MSCSSDTGSPLMGSVPFSAIYFSISRLSNTQLDDGETHGCSGTSLLTIQRILYEYNVQSNYHIKPYNTHIIPNSNKCWKQ